MARKPLTPTSARNAALANLFATPGLGSVMAGRYVSGTGQLILAVTGFCLFALWFIATLRQFYGQIEGNVEVQPVGWLGLIGLAIFTAAWLWSLATSLSLLREVKRNQTTPFTQPPPPPLPSFDVTPRLISGTNSSVTTLNIAQIKTALAALPDWQERAGTITRTFQFKDFPAAIQFVQTVAALAEQAWHHPDIDIRWNKVTLTLTTHDAGGLTEKDFSLAQQFNQLG